MDLQIRARSGERPLLPVAERFFRKLLRRAGRESRVIVTDKLRSYGAAKRIVLPHVIHRQSRYLNNRAENSHQPTRQRERRG
jgi:putative transposase